MNTLGTHRLAARRSMLGVTLLELMAVVMVIGILGMIAIPSYRQYVMRAQRAEAKTALLQLQTNQERFYLHEPHVRHRRAAHRGEPAARPTPGRSAARTRSRSTVADATTLHGYGDAERRRARST